MRPSILFMNYLLDLTTARKVSADHIQHELNYRTSMYVRSWLEGHSRPRLCELPALAKVLKVDPVEMIAGWVIDQCPELEETLWAEVLQPRGSTFPRSDDLALRAPRPRKPVDPVVTVLPRTSLASRARFKALGSMLTNYSFGLMAFAIAPTLFPLSQPPIWITISEVGLAMVFLALAFLIAPRGLE